MAAWRERIKRYAERAEEQRRHHRSVDVGYEMADRDTEIGGGIIAGALAYRLFIWLLPFALVMVAVLGFVADVGSVTPESAANWLGISGLVTASVAGATEGNSPWYALLVGLPILVYTTRSLLRALIITHRLVWNDDRATAPRPTATATGRVLLLIAGFLLVSAAGTALRSYSDILGLVVTLALVIPYAGLWLLISLHLPHRDATWRHLLPGALVFGAGIEVVQLVVVYWIVPLALNKQGTYGALGLAAALLFGLYLAARLMVSTAVLNATLWERRVRAS